MCFSGPLAGTLQGDAGYPRSVVLAQGAGLVINIAANLYLLPRYGIVGAAAASALSYSVSAGIIAAAFARRFAVSLRELLRPEAPWQLIDRLRRA
jgi:O-antigen/teichoic acid export membrane protein